MNSGKNFPSSDLGFVNDNENHIHEDMGQGRELQFPMLRGPEGVIWYPLPGYSESAKFLCDAHREVAFEACVAKGNWSQARYLGIHMPPKYTHGQGKYGKDWKKVMNKTKRNLVAGVENPGMNAACRAYLLYLGDLHVQIVRAIENGVLLSGEVQDLRLIDPAALSEILDSKKVDPTNEQNPYRAIFKDVAMSIGVFHNKWMRQDDSQINAYHKLLMICSE